MKHKEKLYTEEQKEMFKFAKILGGLILIIGLLYVFTVYVVNKEESYKRTNTEGEISYTNIILGTLLNKPDEEYYVLVVDTTNKSHEVFTNTINQYKNNLKHLPIYIADLSNELNKNFIADESSYKIDSVEDLKVKGPTLIKVKNKKIVKFIENIDSVIDELN